MASDPAFGEALLREGIVAAVFEHHGTGCASNKYLDRSFYILTRSHGRFVHNLGILGECKHSRCGAACGHPTEVILKFGNAVCLVALRLL